ncbi:MAG: hypothetical protein QM820_60630 [Minicystis sp.]
MNANQKTALRIAFVVAIASGPAACVAAGTDSTPRETPPPKTTRHSPTQILAVPSAEDEDPPDAALIDKCLKDLKKNDAFNCVSGLMGSTVPTQAQMEGCGCQFTGIGDGTALGERPIYYCGGQPPFFVSPVIGNGNLGIIVPDGTAYPECMFDLTEQDGGAGPIYNPDPDNNCLTCHSVSDPVKPLPDWGTDGGWPGWPLPDAGGDAAADGDAADGDAATDAAPDVIAADAGTVTPKPVPTAIDTELPATPSP